eukprot:gene2088-2377_t
MNKLGPIYAALESQNYKVALKLCNVAIKKKDSVVLQVLKAIAMLKLGEFDDAVKICDSVAFSGVSDDNCISNINYFYRAAGQQDKMCKVWLASHAKHPNELRFAEGVFLSYAKLGDLKQQQQMAITLQKTFPTIRHNMWYLVTMMALVRDTPDNTLYPQLTLRLAEKLAAEDKFKTSEELYIYETILTHLGKNEQYLEVMKGKLGQLYNVPTERLKITADVHTKLSMYSSAAQCYLDIITKYEPDEWSCYMGYFDSLEKAGTFEKDIVCDWVSRRQDAVDPAKLIRAPFIASMEVDLRHPSKDMAALPRMMCSYFKRFGTKPVCFYDLKKFLVNIESRPLDARQAFATSLRELVSADSQAHRISQLSNLHKIERAIGLHADMTAEQANALISSLLNEYHTANHANTSQQSSERVPGDDLVLLCHDILMDMYARDRSRHWLERSAAILEHGHSVSAKNFQFNLALIRLYFELGAVSRAVDHIKILSIKNIQWDTLGYYVFDDLLRLGAFTELFSSFERATRFYTENDSTPEFIAQCFSYEAYTKIFEMQEFQKKIVNSYQKAANMTEGQLLNLFVASHKFVKQQVMRDGQFASIPAASYQIVEGQADKYNFKQDFTVIDTCNPSAFVPMHIPVPIGPNSLTFTGREMDHAQMKQTLAVRRLVLGLIFKARVIMTPANPLPADYQTSIDLLTTTIEAMGYAPLTAKPSNHAEFNCAIMRMTPAIFGLVHHIREVCKTPTQEAIDTVKINMDNVHDQIIECNKVVPSKRMKKKDETLLGFRAHFDAFAKQCETINLSVETHLLAKKLAITSIPAPAPEVSTADLPEFIKSVSTTIASSGMASVNQLADHFTSLHVLFKLEPAKSIIPQ